MARTTGESGASTAATAGPSKAPSGLNREPSQQDLEVARQLIEHSQSIPAQQQMLELHAAKEYQRGGHSENSESSSGLSNQEHHDLDDSSHEYTQPYPSPLNVTLTERTTPSSGGAAVGGQMCRYGR